MADFLDMKPKFPDEALDYDVDWSARLTTGEAITSHSATVVRGSATVSAEGLVSPKQVFWLSGGTAGEEVRVKCEIVTDSVPPRTHEVVVRVGIAKPA